MYSFFCVSMRAALGDTTGDSTGQVGEVPGARLSAAGEQRAAQKARCSLG